jgi:hypothetical protein
MTTARDPIYAGYRFPAELISYAVETVQNLGVDKNGTDIQRW